MHRQDRGYASRDAAQSTKHPVHKTDEVPQIRCLDRVTDVSVLIQRQMPMNHKVQKTVEIPQAWFVVRIVVGLVVMQRQVATVQKAQKTVERSQVQIVKNIGESVDVVRTSETPQLLTVKSRQDSRRTQSS